LNPTAALFEVKPSKNPLLFFLRDDSTILGVQDMAVTSDMLNVMDIMKPYPIGPTQHKLGNDLVFQPAYSSSRIQNKKRCFRKMVGNFPQKEV
jgi:hypothetical protein